MTDSKVENNRKASPGRKKGVPKSGGRKKGTPNRKTVLVHKQLEQEGLSFAQLVKRVLTTLEAEDDNKVFYMFELLKILAKFYPAANSLDFTQFIEEDEKSSPSPEANLQSTSSADLLSLIQNDKPSAKK